MSEYKLLSDYELLSLIRYRDEAAFGEIYNRYWTVIYLHARKILRHQEEAKDITQELFTSLWVKPLDVYLKISFSSYLYKAIRNRIFNYLEHEKVVNNFQRSLWQFMDEGELITDETLREKELAAIIEAEIQRLPAKMREVFELSRKQHLSYREIAVQLEISEHTVKSQVSNALRILRMRIGLAPVIIYLLQLNS